MTARRGFEPPQTEHRRRWRRAGPPRPARPGRARRPRRRHRRGDVAGTYQGDCRTPGADAGTPQGITDTVHAHLADPGAAGPVAVSCFVRQATALLAIIFPR